MEAIRLPTMITIAELSEKSGIPYETIRRWCLQGKIVYVMAGKKRLINLEKFQEFLNGEEVEA